MCLLNDSSLDEQFWAEAAVTSLYIINRSPTTTIGFKTHEEVWLGKQPRYKHMRKFRLVVYVHTDQDKLSLEL